MGSSDSIKPNPFIRLLYGEKVDLAELSPEECSQLLRGFLAHLQPCHRYLPTHTVKELTEHVRPLSSRKQVPADHAYFEPVKLQGIGQREKLISLGVNFGGFNAQLRSEHAESSTPLYWTNWDHLAVMYHYHSNDVGGTVACDIVRVTDEHLLEYFSPRLTEYHLPDLKKILEEVLEGVHGMLERRQKLVNDMRELYTVANTVDSHLVVPKPRSQHPW